MPAQNQVATPKAAKTFAVKDKVDFDADGVEMTGTIVGIANGKAEIETRFGNFFRPLASLSTAK